MADDLEELELEPENKTEKRIKDLSEKAKTFATERDEKDRLLKESQTEKENLSKENDFYRSFGTQLTRYPEASAFQDKIKEKVLKGYSVEDATSAVLVAEGKYTPPRAETHVEQVAGGSAATVHQAGEKPLNQWSSQEKRAKLVEAEARGDITVN